MASDWTVPGIDLETGTSIRNRLQERLTALIDLHLTLKHIHWNVVGPNFIGVHEMLDPQTAAVRGFTDETAERIATLGGEPNGTPGFVAKNRTWDDYPLGRARVADHLKQLDKVYSGVITDHRELLVDVEEDDPITHDMLVGQCEKLELFQWFVRAHLEDASGEKPGG